MSEYIEVGQPLQFTDPNSPTRVGEIVENVSDIYNIPSPRLGMQVFVKSEKKSFVITSLKSKVIGGVDVPEAAVEAFEPVGAKSFTWNNDTDPSNMNDFVVAGVYDIKGEHTREDNLPILNTGGGHSFNARLTVLDSSITGDGKNDDKCITQVMSFNNRLGQGEVYIRTGKGSSLDNLTWEKWSTLQRNVNVGEVTSLDHLIDNGIYSGIWKEGSFAYVSYPFTFVCVVINDYFLGGSSPRKVSQFVYGVSALDGTTQFKYRVKIGNNNWSDWEILNKNEINSMITNTSRELTNYINNTVADAKRDILEGIDPNKIDSIKDIVAWIDTHGGDVIAIYNAIQQNTVKINAEISRAKEAEQTINKKLDDEIKRSAATDLDLLRNIDNEARRATDAEQSIKDKAIEADSLNFQARANEVALDYKTIEGVGDEITIPAATTETAGVMSAEDKVAIDAVPSKIKSAIAEESKVTDEKIATEVNKIKDGDTVVGQAREIHSRNGKTVPDSFLVRTTAGSGTIGDGVATLKKIGGNIVKNLVDGTFESGWSAPLIKIREGVAVITPRQNYDSSRYAGIPYVANHKYYVRVLTYTPTTSIHCIAILGYTNGIENIAVVYRSAPRELWGAVTHIFTAPAKYRTLGLSISADANTGVIAAAKPYFIDLTEMFGAGNEPSKEECDRLFGTMDALPQGLTIANPSTFKSTGFNQFNPDNVLEGKVIVDNAIESGDKKIAVIPCLPCKVGVGENNGYCIHGEFGDDIKVYLTPLNPKDVDGELYMHELTKDATTDTYVPLIKGYMLVEVPTTANLCAHFLWSEDKCDRNSYEPYFESKVELPTIPQMSEYGLAGIQTGGTLVCDEIDFERGVYIKKIGAVNLGSVDWHYDATLLRFRHNIEDIKAIAKEKIPNIIVNGNFSIISAIDFDSSTEISKTIRVGDNPQYPRIYVRDLSYTDTSSFKASLQGVMLYYELATPEEYPLPKVNNNYISSDYGVEQFDSVIPCNANNLYYMRSLVGETRNFLDRMYDNTAKTDAKEVADYITNGIEGNKELATNAPNLALRALFIAAGAEYNDTNNDMVYTTPWADYVDSSEYKAQWNLDVLTGTVQTFTSNGVVYEYIDDGGEWKIITRVGNKLIWDDTKFVHRKGCYKLSGVGHLTDSDMITIYNNKDGLYKYYHRGNQGYNGKVFYPVNNRLMYTRTNIFTYDSSCFQNCSNLTVILFSKDTYNNSFTGSAPIEATSVFYNSSQLRVIMPVKPKSTIYSNTFFNSKKISILVLFGLTSNTDLSQLPIISKGSILFMIKNAAPILAITITLHADAYARLANDADIVAALAAQPLVTLVSA